MQAETEYFCSARPGPQANDFKVCNEAFHPCDTIFTARQLSCSKIIFLHLSVILSAGGVSVWCHFLSGWTGVSVPGPMFLPGRSLWTRVSVKGVSVNGVSVKGGSLKGGFCEGGSLWKETETPWYWHLVVANEAGGTHPTGMHSCLSLKLKQMAIKIQLEPWAKSLELKIKSMQISSLC